jgi:hypothetical protein
MATKADLEKLNKKITALSDALAKLGKGTDAKDLLQIIRKPGWTTIAELALVNLVIDQATMHTRMLGSLMGDLKAAAGKVAPQLGSAAPKKAAKKAASKKAK